MTNNDQIREEKYEKPNFSTLRWMGQSFVDIFSFSPEWKEVDYSDQLVSQLLDWTNTNGRSCNASKCKELTIQKRGNRDLYTPIGMIPSCKEVEILGVTFQCDSKFSVHVKNKLIKTNKSLHILRTLPKEGFNQSEIDPFFNTIVLYLILITHYLSTPRPSPILHLYNVS